MPRRTSTRLSRSKVERDVAMLRDQSAPELDHVAYRGYLIRRRADSGYSITKGGHVIQHQTPTVASGKEIVDSLLD